MMVPKGEFKNLQYCIDQQWVRSDEQYFTLTNNDGINGSFVGSIDFNNKGVSTAAAMLTDIDGYDAIKYTIDTSDVFDEMMSVYLTFETPDGQPYKMADNIMISKPLNYDSLHPI
jgi:hypothetical protein